MAEQLIPCSRRQHDAINELTRVIKANQDQLATVANVILLGSDEEIPKAGVVGARCVDGVYSLVIDVPDIAPATEAPSTEAQAMPA